MNRKSILKLSFFASIIGLLSGLIIGFFLLFLHNATELNQTYSRLIFFLPISGAIMTYTYEKFGKNSHKGNNIIIENINGSDERINFIMAPLVFIGTVLTHLFGGSVGREGTGVQIGGTIGSAFADLININPRERRLLLISGVAAGFSSVFGTPLAGTLFALEVSNIGKFSYSSLLPALISSIVGNAIVSVMGVSHTHFASPTIQAFEPSSFLKVILLGICFGVASRLFTLLTHWFKKLLSTYFKKGYIRTFIGGSLMVLATLLLGTRIYNGLSLPLLSDAFSGDIPTFAFAIKLVLTTLCLGAGYQGGEVTPLFVIGATLGATLSPLVGVPVSFGAALGLIGVFSGATKTPIASFILSIELFGCGDAIFMMIVCILSLFISGNKGIYGSQIWEEL